jgi:hypothetical protein
MIKTRRLQRSFGDGLIAAEVNDLREAWMRHVDAILDDDALVSVVYQALARRHPNSRRRGRQGFPAEMVLRLLVLKHLRNWSYQVLERKSAPIWCIATSPASAATRCRMPRPWVAGAWQWGQR